MHTRLCFLAFIFASLLPAQVPPASPAAPRPSPRQPTMRPEIVGSRGIVAAGRHYSVSAGVRIMEQGGNAIDAGVATVFAAAVVEISHFGFGGECPIIIHDAKTKTVHVINGQGPARDDRYCHGRRQRGQARAGGAQRECVLRVWA